MSAARVAATTMSDAAAHASIAAGGLRLSHRTQACALVTAVAIGCLISWGSDAANSPIMLTRFKRVRCDCRFKSDTEPRRHNGAR